MLKKYILLLLLLNSCFETEKDYYDHLWKMEFKSRIIDAYIDSDKYKGKGRYVLLINHDGGRVLINNTFIQSANLFFQKGDSIFKPKNSMKYYIYKKDTVLIKEY